LLVDAVARLDQKESFVDLCPQRSYLRTAATVALLDARAHQLILIVEQHDGW
jgi:hypothetical protein